MNASLKSSKGAEQTWDGALLLSVALVFPGHVVHWLVLIKNVGGFASRCAEYWWKKDFG